MTRRQHRSFKTPDNREIKIWRYLDFPKFVALLTSRCLFFCQLDQLKKEDPFEGTVSSSWSRQAELVRPGLDVPLRDSVRKQRPWVLVNCWHMNEHESTVMWKHYAGSDCSVCVQSTFARLDDCLPEDVFLGTVKYISYEEEPMDFGNLFFPIMHKRKSFEHERELRAVRCDVQACEKGMERPPNCGESIPVDLGKLIQNIYVAPSAPEWFLKLVEDICTKFELNVPISRSSQDAEPMY